MTVSLVSIHLINDKQTKTFIIQVENKRIYVMPYVQLRVYFSLLYEVNQI